MNPRQRHDMIFGALLMGATGILIGYFVESPLLTGAGGVFGAVIGAAVGWLGGRRFLLIISCGILAGALIGVRSGDRDILIMATGSGGAIAGFIAAHLEQYLRRRK